ncbi:hypothetical protein N7457_004461 [Penicillium paradoxum]|uniref:uncharacterized protein n=1 Tax=Penicillium paradoxum TaxID=176176 RepID=UPI002549A9A4|nr:uncharacterized protein N7457_004461 [Penicillium paradoxum]KAJ5782687.1 hypothetical protein N7457_004461 [Penicillium paradoxum]
MAPHIPFRKKQSETSHPPKERPTANMSELLDRVYSKFEDLTGEKLSSRSIEDLQKLLSADDQAGKEMLSSTTRDNCLQVTEAISALAKPVGEVASLAFPPANACFSALSFLLEIPSKVHAIHESINAVFDEVKPQFTQLGAYVRMKDLDQDLMELVSNVMMVFVELCAQCVKQGKTGKLSRFFREGKWVLLNENPIKSRLDQLKVLCERKESYQSTIMLEQILSSKQTLDGIDTKVGGIQDYVGRRSGEQARQQDLNTIRNRFGMSDDRLLMSHRVFAENSRLATAKSCWFVKWDAYQKWKCQEKEGLLPLLLVIGAQGTGKSVSTASIFLDLKAQVEAEEQSLIAYYTFPPIARTGKDNQQPLENCIRSIGLQVAEQDSMYRRCLLDLTAKKADYKELWKTLDASKLLNTTSCYLLLDGLDNLSESDISYLMDELARLSQPVSSEASRFRLFATGEKTRLQKYTKSDFCMGTAKIEEYNSQEISGYIEGYLKTKDLLQEDHLDFGDLRKRIITVLHRNSSGSFQRAQKSLEKVESLVRSDSRDELIRFLDTLGQGASAPSESELRDLERVLDAKEIEELNEIIIWAEFGSRYNVFDAEEIEAFLFIRSSSTPLRSLRKKIQERFSLVLEEGDYGVRLREDMKQWVIQNQHGRQRPTVTASISITNAEIEVAQRLFWDLAHHSVMNRFNFDTHQVDMAKPSTQQIQVTELNAHLVVVKRTFEFLRRAPHALSQCIGRRLLDSLPEHLTDLRKLSAFKQIADADRQVIGENVQELFFNPMNLERHWETFVGIYWHSDGDAMAAFWEWLGDDAAIKQMDVRDKLQEMYEDPKRNRRLFEPLAKLAGRIWLQDMSSSAKAAFKWLHNYLELDTKDDTPDDASTDSSEDISTGGSDEDDEVSKAEKWCKEALGMRHLRGNDIWLQRIAETYEALYDEQGMDEFQEKAFKKYQKTNKILEKMDDPDRDRRVGVLKRLASLANNEDDAVKYNWDAFRLDPRNIDARYSLFKSLHARRNDQDDVELESLVTSALQFKDSTRHISHLGLMVEMVIKDDESNSFELLNKISFICSSEPYLGGLLEDMETAISDAKAQERYEMCATLLLHKGITLSCYSGDISHSEKAVQAWTECSQLILKNITQLSTGAILLDKVGRQLSAYYFEQAINDLPNAAQYAQKLEQVLEEQKSIVHGMSAAKTYLAAYRIHNKDEKAARDLFKEDMAEAFALLSDETTSNDHRGFMLLSQILLYVRDDTNYLIAFSLLARRVLDIDILKEWLSLDGEPMTAEATELIEFFESNYPDNESSDTHAWFKISAMQEHLEKLSEDLVLNNEDSGRRKTYHGLLDSMARYDKAIDDANNDYMCDICECLLENSTPMYACHYCYNIGFCDSCLRRLKSGALKTPLCRATHHWLQIPPWNAKRHVRSYRRRVWIETTEGEDGSLTEGREIPVEEWLEGLRKEWIS